MISDLVPQSPHLASNGGIFTPLATEAALPSAPESDVFSIGEADLDSVSPQDLGIPPAIQSQMKFMPDPKVIAAHTPQHRRNQHGLLPDFGMMDTIFTLAAMAATSLTVIASYCLHRRRAMVRARASGQEAFLTASAARVVVPKTVEELPAFVKAAIR